MMRIFLDTEFDGPHLISIALVSEDNDELYEIVRSQHNFKCRWVKDNVIPVLGSQDCKAWATIASRVRAYVRQYSHPIILCDWSQDIVHIMKMFYTQKFENCLDKRITIELLSELPDLKSKIPHNALSDARALRDWYLRENNELNKEPPQKFFR